MSLVQLFFSGGWNYFDLLCLACAYTDIVVTALLQKLVLRGLSQGVWPGWHENLSFKYEKAVPFQFLQWTVHLQMLRSISFEMNQLKNSAQEFCLPQCDALFPCS